MKPVIGRDDEKSTLDEAYQSDRAEFIALIGRRRIGKTYLIKNTFGDIKNTLFFNVTGMLGIVTPLVKT